MTWTIVPLLLLFLFSGIKGNPIPEDGESEHEVGTQAEDAMTLSQSAKRIQKRSPCYYLQPMYNTGDDGGDDYLYALRRGRCRYFYEPKQKYSTWDLVRK